MHFGSARQHARSRGESVGWTRRAGSFVLLLVHLLVGTAAIAADAQAVDDVAATHIESTTDRPCAPAHDHATCEFCRLLGSLSGCAPPPPIADPADATAGAAPTPLDAACRSKAQFTPIGPRAPPFTLLP